VPKYLLNNAKITVNGVDLSRFGFSLDTPEAADQIEVTGFNPSGTREYLPGIRTQSIVIGFLQGFGASEVHQTLQPLYSSGTVFAINVRGDATNAPSATNPSFSGSAVLYTYDGLNGQLGARGETVATFMSSGTVGFTWGTV
jgi:hypothetical protein